MKHISKILLLLALFPLCSPAQRPIDFHNLSINEGLSQSIVFCITQDRSGYMWFGTEDGLNRYDGYDFMILRNEQSNSNSLSGNGIVSILEDSEGLLWIGTYGDGLNVFDPKTGEFRHFYHLRDAKVDGKRSEPGFQGRMILSIYEDKEGIVWVGAGSVLNRYDRTLNEFIHYPMVAGDPYSAPRGLIRSILEDEKGNMWIGTQGSTGLCMFDRASEKFYHYGHREHNPQSLSSDDVIAMCIDKVQQLWIGTYGGGLNRVDLSTYHAGDTTLVFDHYLNDPDDPYSLSIDRIAAIHEDARGNLWIGTHNGGLNKLDRESGRFYRYMNDPLIENSLSDNTVYAICEDDFGALWFGTREGVNKFDLLSNKFLTYRQNPQDPAGLASNHIRGITVGNDGAVWLGTSGEGLERLDLSTGNFTHHISDTNNSRSLQNDNIGALVTDRNGNIWIGSDGSALCRYDPSSESFTTFSKYAIECSSCLGGNRVKTMFKDMEDNIWIGSMAGLAKLDVASDSMIIFNVKATDGTSLTSMSVSIFCQTPDSVIWVGTSKWGLIKYDRFSNIFIRYKHDPTDSTSLPSGRIRCMIPASDGFIWIGTLGGGLIKFDPVSETFENWRKSDQAGSSIDSKEGLPNDIVYGILEDAHGNLWMSTNKGISKFNLRDESFRNYDVTDGLQSNEFSSGAFHKSPNGLMVFGGIEGINVFHPDSIVDNEIPPKIVIGKFSVFNQEVVAGSTSGARLSKPINYTDTLFLTYKDYVFSFEFAALHYGIPEKNQYAYQMVGFENDWNYVGSRRFATYTNLDPGEYRFRVKGSNHDGIWNEEGKSIYIVISPPFWQTWWFRILTVLAVVSGVIIYIKLREASLKKQRELLRERVRIKTTQLRRQKEEIEEKNRDITDSIEYASNIQKAILPKKDEMAGPLPDNFVFFAPRDIVSGDFYWFREKKDKIFIAACDCTGHGVPGAFLSMIGNDLLNQLIIEKGLSDPGEILNQLSEGIHAVFTRKGAELEAKDGMDMTLVVFDKNLSYMEFAGAQNSVFIFRKSEGETSGSDDPFTTDEQDRAFKFREITGDRTPIGGRTVPNFEFTRHEVDLNRGDAIYLFSDGFLDQFGGKKGKKFTKNRFLEMLFGIQNLSMNEQKFELEASFKKWQGNEEQLDDVLVIGIRV